MAALKNGQHLMRNARNHMQQHILWRAHQRILPRIHPNPVKRLVLVRIVAALRILTQRMAHLIHQRSLAAAPFALNGERRWHLRRANKAHQRADGFFHPKQILGTRRTRRINYVGILHHCSFAVALVDSPALPLRFSALPRGW